MTHRERVQAAVDHREPDRVPCHFGAEADVCDRLVAHFGLDSRDDLQRFLDTDRRSVGPRYVGPDRRTFPDGSRESPYGGPRRKVVQTEFGAIDTIVHFPWADVVEPSDLDDKLSWAGKPEWWDFDAIGQEIAALDAEDDYWITAHGDPASLQHVMIWRGDEQFLLDLAADPDLARALIEKQNAFMLEKALKTLEAGKGRINELGGGGDYGTQNGPLISVDMFRTYFKDTYAKFYKTIKDNFDVKIFFHCCGGILELIPELIEVGVDILNPIQVRAQGMDIRRLKREFGTALTFDGAIDIQETLPHATPEQVRREVRETIDVLGAGGGYILGPTHAIQGDTPVENIVAMYEEAQQRRIG